MAPAMRRVSLVLPFALAACAAAPPPPVGDPTPGVVLRRVHHVGQAYVLRSTVETAVGDGVLRSVTAATGSVIAVDADGTATLRWDYGAATVERVDAAVRVPPSDAVLAGVTEIVRVDERGRVLSRRFEGPPERVDRLAAVARDDSPRMVVFPPAAVRPGQRWDVDAGPGAPVAFTLVTVEEGDARIRSSWTTAVPSTTAGRVTEATMRLAGEVRVSLRDGVTGRASHRVSHGAADEPELDRYAPTSAVETCVAPVAEGLESVGCDADSAPRLRGDRDVGGERPAARVYEGQGCEERAAALREHLEGRRAPAITARDVDALVGVPEGGALPTAPGLALRLTADGATVDGARLSAEQLASSVTEGAVVYALLERDVSAAEALAILGPLASRADLRLVGVTVASVGRHVPPTAPDWLAPAVARVDELEGDERRLGLHVLADAAAPTCAPAATALAEALAGRVEGLAALPDAAIACGCRGVDVDAAEALVDLLPDRDARSLRAVPLPLSTDRAAPRVRLGRSATARDLMAAAVAAGGRVRILAR